MPRTSHLARLHRTAPASGATHTYTSHGGTFLISSHHRTRTHVPYEGAWTLTHVPSGAVMRLWSQQECVEMAHRVMSRAESEVDRWVVMDGPAPAGGWVLFDRGSGRWWRRGPAQPVTDAELLVMAALSPLKRRVD